MQVSWLISSLFLAIVVTNVHVRTTTALVKTPRKIPAIMVFGDSMFDAGNNNNILARMKSNYPPYGANFGVATGRFSNSKVLSEIIAEQLGIKYIVPAYSTINLTPEDLLSGVTFASGGAGYDVLTSTSEVAISLDNQLKNLKAYRGKVEGLIGVDKTNSLFANSLSLVSAGGNDIMDYFDYNSRRLKYDLNAYTDFIANTAADFATNLYGAGVRKIGVLGVLPIGCAPSRRTATGCAENLNQAATLLNSKLTKTLAATAAKLPDSRIVFMDIYNDHLEIIKDPANYGFAVIDKPCCGTGNADVKYLCNKETPSKCADSSDYVYWDGYHPTEDTYQMLFSVAFQRYVDQFF